MLDKLFSLLGTIFVVTAIGIALRPGAPTAKIITAFGNTLVGAQKAAYPGSKVRERAIYPFLIAKRFTI